MKISLIIILLALTIFTYGQGGFDPLRYIDSPTEYSGSIQPRLFTLREMIYNNYDHFIMERYLRRGYIEHCYADSVVEVYIVSYPGKIGEFWFDIYPPDTIHPSDLLVASDIDTLYSHRQPTFEGYVEWLEEILTQSDK